MGNSQTENHNSKEEIKIKRNENTTHKKEETKTTEDAEKQLLDIAFVLDCTGSMNSYIQSCKDNINKIAQTINKQTDNTYNTQFGLILYRDIPPEDTSFITQRIDFTPIPLQIQLKLNKMQAQGGGDHPEALTSALYDCYKNLKWRRTSVKVIVVITDAPPHGIEKQFKDGFPNGDIDTFNDDEIVQKEGVNDANDKKVVKYLNAIEIIKNIRNELNASIYSVACEPSLSLDSDFGRDFMQYMAEYTSGKFLPLSSATLLPSVIIGSVQQQINLDNLANKLEEDIILIKKEHGEEISNDKLNELVAAKWKNEGIERNEIEVSDVFKIKRSRENIDLLMNEQVIKSLNDFKNKCKDIPRMKITDYIHLNLDEAVEINSVEEIKSVEDSEVVEDRKGSIFANISNGFKSLWKNQTGAALSSVQAVMEQEMGFGAGLYDNGVGFNPLATGFNPNAPAGGVGPNAPPDGNAGGGYFIRPNVEKPVFKQHYGQVVSMRSGMSSGIVASVGNYANRRG